MAPPKKSQAILKTKWGDGDTARSCPQKSQIVLKTKWGDDEEENGGRVMGIFYFNAYDDRRLAVLGANRRGGTWRAHWGNFEA